MTICNYIRIVTLADNLLAKVTTTLSPINPHFCCTVLQSAEGYAFMQLTI